MQKRKKIIIYVVVISCCAAVLVTSIAFTLSKDTSNPTVETDCGSVEGRSFRVTSDNGEKQKVYQFLNIPYAAPPTGRLRWRAPVGLKNNSSCWKGTLNYNEERIRCPQVTDKGEVIGKEDCLILSVRTPSIERTKNLPVLAWIHGGGMVVGDSRQEGYYPDVEFTASMEVVSVSINYRLGMFGFLSLKELWENSTSGGYGNYAIMDQILALRWVKENIKGFGGNPNDVTIFGQSGGGTAVFCLLSASLGMSKGLFKKVIASSGAPNVHTTYKEADLLYRPFLNKTKCSNHSREDTQTCLRELDANTVILSSPTLLADYELTFPLNVQRHLAPLQIIDPFVIKHSPSDLLPYLQALPEEHRIDILMGNMAQEPMSQWKPHLPNWSNWTVLEQYMKPLVESFNSSYTELLGLYQNRTSVKFTPTEITPYYMYSVITADVILSCATTKLAYNLSQYDPFKVYSYIVSQPLTPTSSYTFYAQHTFDVIPLFNFLLLKPFVPFFVPTPEDKQLKTNLRKMFKDFIYSSKTFESVHRNKTTEFWNSTTVHTWENPYHERECNYLHRYGFLKHSWGNKGIWDS